MELTLLIFILIFHKSVVLSTTRQPYQTQTSTSNSQNYTEAKMKVTRGTDQGLSPSPAPRSQPRSRASRLCARAGPGEPPLRRLPAPAHPGPPGSRPGRARGRQAGPSFSVPVRRGPMLEEASASLPQQKSSFYITLPCITESTDKTLN